MKMCPLRSWKTVFPLIAGLVLLLALAVFLSPWVEGRPRTPQQASRPSPTSAPSQPSAFPQRLSKAPESVEKPANKQGAASNKPAIEKPQPLRETPPQPSTSPPSGSPLPKSAEPAGRNAPPDTKEENPAGEQRIRLMLNGAELDLQPPPLLSQGQVFLSLEAWERLGCHLEWAEEGKLAVVCYEDRCVPLRVEDGEEVLHLGGRTYAPAQRVGEALGMKVSWNHAQSTLSITS